MTNFIPMLHDALWGVPLLGLILGIGMYIGIRTRFVQLRLLGRSLGELLRRMGPSCRDGVSPFQALCTALAATVGTGNLVGVAGAICLGGPGAIFWMWICGLLGMGIKFAEVTLAQRYRVREGGEMLGGPMYMIRQGLDRKWRFLGMLYALFGILASFGVGNATQISALVGSVNSALARFGIMPSGSRNLGIGLLLGVAVGLALHGGAGRIGRLAQALIPVVSAMYILLCAVILIARFSMLDDALGSILLGAFSPASVTGGLVGSGMIALRTGCARGIFTNEAGMGTASIAHASARTDHPCRQGLLGIVEVFLDTIVMCTMTALVILVSGVPVPYGTDAGGSLTSDAFSHVLGDWVSIFLAAALSCFAFATVLGWGLYAERCVRYLLGRRALAAYTGAQTITVVLGAVMNTEGIWLLAETVNGLMAIPNLIALAALSKELRRLTIEYERKSGTLDTGGGKPCRFPSTPTAANPLPCANSTPWQWLPRRRARRSIT